ncbi:HAD family hydrolase [Caballeronia sp. LP006]|uniref:HAD family hydrolase n=1 Tax=unclassified Caballeronia TaxID=2646786 RepID=UPI002863EEE2|nr:MULTISPECIES: HAD family hydrolase [unclassified Caballeronia]MDR5805722.1 HAD family hydrolase [Caballeronia sp. LZ001]MDR5826966.1 HAD family hydrolase [Caballeronia sp. LP006]
MIKLCLLDFDGTLCATHDAIRTCIELTFDHYGVERPDAARVEHVIEAGVVMSEAMRQLMGSRLSVAQADEWAATYRAYYVERGLQHTQLFADVERVLTELQTLGVALVITSNKAEASVKKAIDHYGIAHFFDMLVCDPPGLPKKPDAACYEQLIAPRYPHVPRGEIAVVGDTQADLGLARNIGAIACWAAYGYGDKARCTAMEPDIVLQGFGELVEKLKA